MTRLETQKEASFTNNCEKRVNFLKRMKLYDQRLHGQANQSIFVSQTANWQTKSVPKPVKILQKIEKRDNKLIVATTISAGLSLHLSRIPSKLNYTIAFLSTISKPTSAQSGTQMQASKTKTKDHSWKDRQHF